MGLMDNFTSDGTVTMKHSEYYNLMREAAKAELITNAIAADVPNCYTKAMITGEKPEIKAIPSYSVGIEYANSEGNKTVEQPVEAEQQTKKEETQQRKHCSNCESADVDVLEEPCSSCDKGSNYKAEEPQTEKEKENCNVHDE